MCEQPVPQSDAVPVISIASFLLLYEKAIIKRWLGSEQQPEAERHPVLKYLNYCLTGDDVDRIALVKLMQVLPLDVDDAEQHLIALNEVVAEIYGQEIPAQPESNGELAQLTLHISELRNKVLRLYYDELYSDSEDLRTELSTFYEHTTEPVVIVEPRGGRIRQVNEAALLLTGFQADRLRNLSLADLSPDFNDARLMQLRAEIMEDGYLDLPSINLVRSDGAALQCNLRVALVRQGGRHVFLCLIQASNSLTSGLVAMERRASDLQVDLTARLTEIERLKSFLEKIISALPIRVLVLDRNLRVIHANPAYYVQRGLSRDEVIGKHADDILPVSMLEDAGLRAALLSVLETGERVRWSSFREMIPERGERILNIRLDPCEGPDGATTVLITLEDITERHWQLYERTVLQQIAHALLGELQLPRLLHAILTGMTAGGAVGLGFNRAILMLVDNDKNVLRAQMAVGPESLEQAMTIWQEVSERHRTFEDFLYAFAEPPTPDKMPLRDLVEKLVIPLDDVEHLPMAAIIAQRTVHVVDAELDTRVTPELHELLGTDEFVIAPLMANDEVIGVAIADNRFSHHPITQAAVQLLTALADHAALAIHSANTFSDAREKAEALDIALNELKVAQESHLKNAQLAAIGEVTAIVAHEIRGPLSAIGGFARSIQRDPEMIERTARNAKIIVEEVVRLERILSELLDFSRPLEPSMQLNNLNEIILSVAEHARQADETKLIQVNVDAESDIPLILADEKQIRQILTNLVMNAMQAMLYGGTLTLRLFKGDGRVHVEVIDTGEGIPKDRLDKIFDAFYTSKPTGTGLGLALCKKLATQHGAEMTVRSEEGLGTTFSIIFPVTSTNEKQN